jgi:hypothetical protein
MVAPQDNEAHSRVLFEVIIQGNFKRNLTVKRTELAIAGVEAGVVEEHRCRAMVLMFIRLSEAGDLMYNEIPDVVTICLRRLHRAVSLGVALRHAAGLAAGLAARPGRL